MTAPRDRRPRAAAFDRVLDALAGRYPPTMLGAFAGRLPAFQILIGTILSARSRDEATDKVCSVLFKQYPTPARLAAARPADLIPLLRPIGFYRQKASFITETARLLLARHGGEVPRTLDELTALPGVGRKVANCVLVYAFGVPAIPVDTHVHRIANRLGWVRTRTPEETERALAARLPRRHWLTITDLLVGHGKAVCRPLGPRCGECPVARWCAHGRARRPAPA
ncbi:MAG: endonuclease III [Planctomycetes bacterium]|nr:endonuclease III [Planctomycetota bacterium]